MKLYRILSSDRSLNRTWRKKEQILFYHFIFPYRLREKIKIIFFLVWFIVFRHIYFSTCYRQQITGIQLAGGCESYFRLLPKQYQKCNSSMCWQYACISNVYIFNVGKFVGCQYEWRNGIVCSHSKWNVAVLYYACTIEQFQTFWRTHTRYSPNYFDVSFSLFRLQFSFGA